MSLKRELCFNCQNPLWRADGECRLCWLDFKDDDRNTRVGVHFWGRRRPTDKLSFFFDWPALHRAAIARAGARALAPTRAIGNSTEDSPATSLHLPEFSTARTAEYGYFFGFTDEQQYSVWLQLRAFSPSFKLDPDLKIHLE